MRTSLVLQNIRQRCNNPKSDSYKYYGAKGIKCLLFQEDLDFLAKRDKANEMKRPSIDRIDPNGNYELSNCRFIELSENCRRSCIQDRCQNGHLYKDHARITLDKNGHRDARCKICHEAYLKIWRRKFKARSLKGSKES